MISSTWGRLCLHYLSEYHHHLDIEFLSLGQLQCIELVRSGIAFDNYFRGDKEFEGYNGCPLSPMMKTSNCMNCELLLMELHRLLLLMQVLSVWSWRSYFLVPLGVLLVLWAVVGSIPNFLYGSLVIVELQKCPDFCLIWRVSRCEYCRAQCHQDSFDDWDLSQRVYVVEGIEWVVKISEIMRYFFN